MIFTVVFYGNLGAIKKVKIGTAGITSTIDVTAYKGWKNFTNNNFSLTPNINNSWMWGNNANWRISGTGSISYNSSTGIVTVSPITGQYGFNWQNSCNVSTDIYLHYNE